MLQNQRQDLNHLAIAAWEWPSYFDAATKMKGIRLDIADYRRPDPRTAPCASKAAGLYMICTISKHRAENKGYADALMLDFEDNVAECTGANVFFIRDGAIHTPTADRFLNGITRQTVIDLARRRGIAVTERRIRRGVFRSVAALEAAIREYLEHHNASPKPFVWTPT